MSWTRIVVLVIVIQTIINIYSAKSHKPYEIDRTFQPYVERFVELGIEHVGDLDLSTTSIQFTDFVGKQKGIIGMCKAGMARDGVELSIYRHITIDRKFWATASYLKKEQLIFHELAHCILFRPHIKPVTGFRGFINRILTMLYLRSDKPTTLPDGCPISYMNPYIIGDHCTEKHYDHYLKELFNP